VQRQVDEVWQRSAACRGPESVVFYPPTANETRLQRELRESRAKVICAGCPVRAPCLDHALDIMEPHGIWGGLTEQERQVLLAGRVG
jgi:WhiB family redox-sensing transcriptional regulator